MKKITINWTWVFWISLTILFLWLIANEIGLIHTPLVIELIPYLTGFAVLFAIAKKFGEYMQKIERVIFDVGEVKSEVKEVKEDIQGLRGDVHKLDKRLSLVEAKI